MSIVWNVYVARSFSTKLDDLGVYLFIITQFGIFSILAEGNISYAFQHFISKDSLKQNDSDEKYWSFSFYSKILLGLIFGLGLYFVVINQYPNSSINALLIAITLFAFNIGSATFGILIAHNQFKLQIYSYLINSILFTIGALIIVSLTKNITYILMVLFIANLIAAIYSLYHGFKLYGLPILVADFRKFSLKIMRFSIPLLIASFCFTFFYRMDVNVIAKTMSPKYVSYVSMAMMFYFLIVDLLWSQLASAMTPNLLRRWSDGQDSRNYVVERFISLLSIYSILTSIMCVGLIFFGNAFFDLVLGKSGGFQNVLPILYYLLLGLPFLVGYAFFYRLFLINNTSFSFMLYSSFILLVKFLLVFLFHDILGFQLLVIISGVMLIIVYILFIFFMSELNVFKKLLLVNLYKILFVNLLLFSIVFFFPGNHLTLSKIFYGLLICLFSVFLFRGILINELSKLKIFKQNLS